MHQGYKMPQPTKTTFKKSHCEGDTRICTYVFMVARLSLRTYTNSFRIYMWERMFNIIPSLLKAPVEEKTPHCCWRRNKIDCLLYPLKNCACVMLYHCSSTLSVAKTEKEISKFIQKIQNCVLCIKALNPASGSKL